VGQKLASLLTIEKEKFTKLHDTRLASRIRVVGIVTLSKGGLYDKDGIDLVQALGEIKKEGKFLKENPSYTHLNSIQALHEWSYDIVIELSSLNIEKKGEPATTHLTTALTKGKHVISANKGPLAFHWQQLKKISQGKECIASL